MKGPAPSAVRAVVLDIGRVLVDFDVSRAVAHLAAAAAVPERRAEQALFGPHYRAFVRGELDGPGFHAAVCRGLGREVPYDRFVGAWCDMFQEMPGMPEVAAALARAYPLYLCSNTDPLHYEFLRRTVGAFSLARGAVLSYEAHCEKPEPEIFEELIGRFQLDPPRTLFVDDLEVNVAGAGAVGLRALLFRGTETLRAELTAMGVLPR
jgi:putative hydrolase of the HAD superfamily